MLITFFDNLWQTLSISAPWLIIGLLIAGLIKAKVSNKWIARHLSGEGSKPVAKGALIGAPLPLCSCSVIPVATQLHRSGASKGATAAFLVSTPETGVDSISLSYALLGPFMAVVRPIAAIISAIITGLGISWLERKESTKQSNTNVQTTATRGCESESDSKPVAESACCSSELTSESTSDSTPEAKSYCDSAPTTSSCCGEGTQSSETKTTSCCETETKTAKKIVENSSCCGSSTEKEEASSCCASQPAEAKMTSMQGIHYAFTQMLDDMKKWLLIGLVLSALVMTFIPNDFLLQYQNQWWIYLLVFIASFPVYICASASTPVAAGLMLAGLSPGAALIFMLAGPSTNIATLGVLKQELGANMMKMYIASLAVTSILLGVIVDWIAHDWQLDFHQQLMHHHEFLPGWVSALSVLILFTFGIKAIRRIMLR